MHLGTRPGRPAATVCPCSLVLDEPSRCGPSVPGFGSRPAGRTRDDDDAVQALYRLLHGFTHALDGRMQIIVTDHASFDWFRNAIVEGWQDGHALVPAERLVDPDGAGRPARRAARRTIASGGGRRPSSFPVTPGLSCTPTGRDEPAIAVVGRRCRSYPRRGVLRHPMVAVARADGRARATSVPARTVRSGRLCGP